MTKLNKQIRLASRPTAGPAAENFRVDSQPVPPVADETFLVRVDWVSVDPFMVGRLRDEYNYAEKVGVGDVMHAYGVGEVIGSRHPDFPIGTFIYGFVGMQEYALLDGSEQVRRLDPALAPPSTALGMLGIAGITAYWGLLGVGKPQEGETVVVSAAAGSVGLLVGQIAKIVGCRVVGVAGSDEKCSLLVDSFGFDAAVNYKSEQSLTELLGEVLPDGVDVYFDNVGGAVYEAVLHHCNKYARLVICGRLSTAHLSDTSLDVGVRDHNAVLVKAVRKEGFLAVDWLDKGSEAIADLAAWRDRGLVKLPEEWLDGIENAPAAFLRMLDGRNIGKQLVRVNVADKLDSPTSEGASA